MAEQLQINIGADTKQLEAGLQRAEKAVVEFDKGVNRSALATDKAKIALGNLARVAQDAPFGFIAIANNLDPLIQSLSTFGNTAEKGVLPKLKALGSALSGGAGIALAFSTVSALVTVAIQKYGTLGNAINALFGSYDPLIKQIQDAADSYAKFNKELKTTEEIQSQAGASVQGEISKVQALAAIITDQTKSYGERNQAKKDLIAIDKTYFGNIDLEKSKLADVTNAVNAYTQATIQAAVTKGFESEIGRVSVELSKQEAVLKKLIPALGDAAAAQAKQSQALPGIGQAAQQAKLASAAIDATSAYVNQNKVVQDLRGQLTNLNTAIGESINKYNGIVAPVTAANDAQEKSNKEAAKGADAIKKKNKETEREIELERKRIERLDQRLANAETLRPVVGLGFEIDDKNLEDNLSRLKVAYQDGLKKFTSVGDQIVNTIPKLPKDFKLISDDVIAQSVANGEKLRLKLEETVGTITAGFNTLVAPAIDAAFSALENGTSVIDSVKSSLKGLLIQLAANAAKALLLSAALRFIPGAGAVAGGGLLGGAGGGGGIGSLLSGLFGGGGGLPSLRGAAAPTFGGVAGFGGGLNLAGQVVFVQRGGDLVGVLNNSNARINRVG